jgi:hypothetical protein
VVTLCGAVFGYGAALGDDGSLIVAKEPRGSLFRVPAGGGPAEPLTKLVGATTHRWPQILPGGEAVLFTASPGLASFDSADIEVASLKTGEPKVVVRGGYYGRYVSGGHLLYLHDGVLYGIAFDVDRLEV